MPPHGLLGSSKKASLFLNIFGNDGAFSLHKSLFPCRSTEKRAFFIPSNPPFGLPKLKAEINPRARKGRRTSMRKAKALCPDAKIRTVYYGEPDTFFSIPAYVIVHRNRKGVTVRGFITMSHPDDIPPSLRTERGYEFHPYAKYERLIPNYLASIKAMWRKATLGYPPKWRWIWDSLQYNEKWGTA